MELVYLATPYSDENPDVREKRYEDACKIAGHLVKQGYIVYSPIVHWHNVAKKCNLPTGIEFWGLLDETFLRRCDRMYIANMDGYLDSKGITFERSICDLLNIPYELLDVKEILSA